MRFLTIAQAGYDDRPIAEILRGLKVRKCAPTGNTMVIHDETGSVWFEEL